VCRGNRSVIAGFVVFVVSSDDRAGHGVARCQNMLIPFRHKGIAAY
jgi:hypothetical protein